MTRIHRSNLLFGALLLLTLVMEPCAFTMKTPFRPPSFSRRSIGRFVATVDQDSVWPERLSATDIAENGVINLEEQDDDTSESIKTGSRLPWLLMLVALLQSQFFQSSTVPGAESVALSTVSATLLRSSNGSKFFSTQQFLAGAVLAWQVITNLGLLMNWVQVAGSAFSLWYMGCLSSYPIYTKALTTGVIGFMGDGAAQLLEERIRSKKESTRFQIRGRFDRRRAFTNVADGIFVTGPLLHFAYNFLESLIPVSGAATGLGASLAAITQVLIDDFILDAIFVGIMFVTTGLGEGYNMRDIAKQFRKDYIGTIRTSWATSVLLMPLEFTLFRFFPLSLRVLGMNLLDIAWEGMVSFLVHKRRRSQTQEQEVNEMQNMLARDHAPVPAH